MPFISAMNESYSSFTLGAAFGGALALTVVVVVERGAIKPPAPSPDLAPLPPPPAAFEVAAGRARFAAGRLTRSVLGMKAITSESIGLGRFGPGADAGYWWSVSGAAVGSSTAGAAAAGRGGGAGGPGGPDGPDGPDGINGGAPG